MSIPAGEIVYAGIWNNATTYRQNDGVVSPADNLFYVNIDTQPVTGGSDPSVQPSTTWLYIPAGANGDITSVIAGTGLSGGGSTGAVTLTNAGVISVTAGTGGVTITGTATNPVVNVPTFTGILDIVAGTGISSTSGQTPTLSNSGVLSLNGQTGALVTAYGSFSSTQIQPATAATVLPLTYDTADVTPVGVSWTSGSPNITVTAFGMYKILASVQLDKTTGGNASILLFPSVNGTPVPNSATSLNMNQNQEDIMTIEWFLQLNAGQIVNINLYSISSGCRALSITEEVGPPAIPAVPSIITTILRIA